MHPNGVLVLSNQLTRTLLRGRRRLTDAAIKTHVARRRRVGWMLTGCGLIAALGTVPVLLTVTLF